MTYFDLTHSGHTYRIHCRPPRKNNRRLRLSVDASGITHLSSPPRTSQTTLRAFAEQHLHWIAARAEPLEKLASRPAPYAEGSTHWLLGKAHTLRLDGTQKRLIAANGILHTAAADAHELATRFKNLHRELSAAHIPALVQNQLPRCWWVSTMPPIRYRTMRKTWGTCRHDGILTFNTRLIQYPVEQIEHVIIHELCHLAVFDHSEAFYACMNIVQPDWRARKTALQTFARRLPIL